MEKRYSDEFKESMIKKMLPPNSVPVLQLHKESGVSDVTLYKWRKEFINKGISVPSNHKKSDNWLAQDKLAVVIETAALNNIQLSEYCRNKGLFPEQVESWKQSALTGYIVKEKIEKDKSASRQEDKKKIKSLEAELRRKDKALAETAALLVLSKKCEAIWGVIEED